MKIIIHDLDNENFINLLVNNEKDTVIISDNGTIHNCIGCFGCWIKTPGECVLKDQYNNMGKLLSKCHQLIIISKCIYGSYSAFIRNVFERSISYLLPYFTYKKGETHHENRYENNIQLEVHFYGNSITEKEKSTAEALVEANAVNFYSSCNKVYFYDDVINIKGAI